MSRNAWEERPLAPFGMEIDIRLDAPLPDGFEQRLVDLFDRHKMLIFRNQVMTEADQVRILENFGRVLGAHGEYREISSDGALGSGPLTWHSDLAFTEEPYKIISLHAVAVNDGESWTAFANSVDVAARLPEELAGKIRDRQAVTVIAPIQSSRVVDYDTSTEMPHQIRPLLIPHPRTGEPVLYINWMQTSRIEGMDRDESEATLARLFDELYREDRIYTHHWNNGDFVIWDNIALQHSRCDLTGMNPRKLQRIVIADKSFFDLLPQFQVGDNRISAWGSGGKELVLD
ncbi:taurine dioxygenase [Sphingobium sp. OAS761]|uniref:TauD/TfdA dioxygenase family protein n=1 Tax=Sphingobium sp. OAS761 TaxID=2817901 RepID=UPI00209E20A3|nr:TauD/TfdA family dioxygenase [Sphingobium sp. OAS761]MCP1470427.1 taurine dioxygenase [Sphingobium sp. OAS761]